MLRRPLPWPLVQRETLDGRGAGAFLQLEALTDVSGDTPLTSNFLQLIC